MIKEELNHLYSQKKSIKDITTELFEQKELVQKKLFIFAVLEVIEAILEEVKIGANIIKEISIGCESIFGDTIYTYKLKFNNTPKNHIERIERLEQGKDIDLLLNALAYIGYISEYFKEYNDNPIVLTLNVNQMSPEQIEHELLDKLLPQQLKTIYLTEKIEVTTSSKDDKLTKKNKI